MDMEGILAITFIFGGGSLFLLAISPIGRAIANRIQGHVPGSAGMSGEAVKRLEAGQQAVMDELEVLRNEVVDMQERLDFTERIIAQQREAPRLAGGGEAPQNGSS